jgi:hypothetical protein
MKVYQVECRAVVTVSEQGLEKAALHAAALLKDNLDLFYVRAVHEMNFEPTGEDPSLNQKRDRRIHVHINLPANVGARSRNGAQIVADVNASAV